MNNQLFKKKYLIETYKYLHCHLYLLLKEKEMIPNTHHRWVDLAAWVLHCPCLFGSVMYQARSRIYHIPGDFIIYFLLFLKKKILYFVKKKIII